MDVNGKRRIRGAIFDLDGTLLDSLSVWETLAEDYLRSLGKEPREDLNRKFAAFTLEEAAAYYQAHYGVALSKEEIIAGINGRVRAFYENTVPLKKGADRFLAEMHRRGIRMCVLTLTDRGLACAALRRLGVLSCFREVITCTGTGKAEAEAFLAACALMGTEPEETAVFEDSLYALRTAKKAGMIACAVWEEAHSDKEEIRNTADVFLPDFSDPAAFFREVGGCGKTEGPCRRAEV